MTSKAGAFRLEPDTGVEIVGGDTVATSLPAWLRVEPAARIARHRWVRIRYASGFFDEPVRPLIRFTTASGAVFVQPMNGAVLGAAEWTGRVPDHTVAVTISPCRRLGRFSFRIESVTPVARHTLLRRGLVNEWPWAYWSMRSRLINSRQEAWQALRYAIGGTPLARYAEWHARMTRPLDLDGFDRPHSDWTAAPAFRLLTTAKGSTDALERTMRSLREQVYRNWSLHVALDDASPALRDAFARARRDDDRFAALMPAARFADNDRLTVIDLGDTLAPVALAAMAEACAERPDQAALYADEDAARPDGAPHAPVLKPDWSPALHAHASYVGRLCCLRQDAVAAAGQSIESLLASEQTATAAVLAAAGPHGVGHVRRILYRRHRDGVKPQAGARVPAQGNAAEALPSEATFPTETWPKVDVVIPTKNQATLLAACIDGLRTKTDYPAFDVIVIDNGSTEPDALALLAQIETYPGYTVLRRPEPFNYAKLSNDGARAGASPMLAFLNNDIAMLDAGWLKALVRFARRPDVGVVGAKLLFPNGKIQHAGVVLGMGGIAGHLYRRSAADATGYLCQLAGPREMAAVTAACIAIARDKFEAIGGFDAANLPIDLNDMDLCLRAGEKGWTNIWTPDALLTHVQSASRGIERDPYDIYRQERTYFTQRWIESIRDDPYFHPGLSLFAHWPSLA